MSDALEDLLRRVAALKECLLLEASLRDGDDDLSDMPQMLSAQQHTIQALAITQSQYNEKLDQQNERLNRHEASLSAAHSKLDQIVTLLTELIDRDVRGGG